MAGNTGTPNRKAQLLFTLIGNIPLGLGKRLRRSTYSKLFHHLGQQVEISPQVEFINPERMSLADNVVIWQHASLNCWTANSQIVMQSGSVIDRGVYLQPLGGKLYCGENTYIGPHVCIAGPGDIHIGDNCLIASHCSIYGNSHIFVDPNTPINQQSLEVKGVTIGNDCWLGSGVRVMDGVSIGEGSVIGANAVVVKDIPSYSIAVGVPAKVIKSRR